MDIICNEENFFKNPEKLPLNKVFLEFKQLRRPSKPKHDLDSILNILENKKNSEELLDHCKSKTEKRCALDKCWIDPNKSYVEYQPYYPQFGEIENNQFLTTNQQFLESLEYLVQCSYQQFWCYISFEPSVNLILEDFLQHANSPYFTSLLKNDFLKLYDEIYTCVCYIYQRLMNYRHSETEYMEKDVVLNILKKTQLFSINSILLLCYLYKHSNPEFIAELMNFYFSHYRKENINKHLTDLLLNIREEFDKFIGTAISLTNTDKYVKPNKRDLFWVEEVSFYILELVGGATAFLSTSKESIDVAFEIELPNRISHCYKTVYTHFFEVLRSKPKIGSLPEYEELIKRWISLGRAEFVNLFHVLVTYCLDKISVLKDDRQTQEKYLEMYIDTISNTLDDDLFIIHYNTAHSLEKQFNLVNENVPDFDKTQTDYLLQSLKSVIDVSEPKKPKAELKQKSANLLTQFVPKPFPQDQYKNIQEQLIDYLQVKSYMEEETVPGSVTNAIEEFIKLKRQWKTNPYCWLPTPNDDIDLSEENGLSEKELSILVKAVLAALPDLETDFVIKCLKSWDFNPDLVISKILDGEVFSTPQETYLDNSHYDYDTPGPSGIQNNPKDILVKYQKPDLAKTEMLLNNKSEKEQIKMLVLQASHAYDYDEEYDDRDYEYCPMENGDDDEKVYRHLKMDNISLSNQLNDASSSSEEEPEQPIVKDAFCEDPAVIRARREAQRNQKEAQRGRKNHQPNRDVVGKPKGQEQDKTVVQNRDKKNTQKSSKANHNRRSGAQWKRTRGMIPS